MAKPRAKKKSPAKSPTATPVKSHRPRWKVREAAPQDRESIDELFNLAHDLHVELSPAFFRRGKALWSIGQNDEAIFVATDSLGIVCGLSHVQIFDTPDTNNMVRTRRANVQELIVAEAQRKKGCGRALVEVTREWAKVRGATKLILTVWSGNRGAEKFYQKLGFEPVSQVLGTDL